MYLYIPEKFTPSVTSWRCCSHGGRELLHISPLRLKGKCRAQHCLHVRLSLPSTSPLYSSQHFTMSTGLDGPSQSLRSNLGFCEFTDKQLIGLTWNLVVDSLWDSWGPVISRSYSTEFSPFRDLWSVKYFWRISRANPQTLTVGTVTVLAATIHVYGCQLD